MTYRELPLGSAVAFLLPSLKLKGLTAAGTSVEGKLHTFLMDHFDGYTAQAGNIFGYWRDQAGHESYGEHREFSVAFVDPGKLGLLKTFLSELAADLGEECIYLRADDAASLIYPIR
jgi:hypothetical protein